MTAHALPQINYEDIAAASRKMIVFVGLPWDDEVLRFHQSPVSKGRHHPQGLAPLRATIELPEAELA